MVSREIWRIAGCIKCFLCVLTQFAVFLYFFKKNLLYLPSDLICFIYLSSDLVQNTARLLKQKDTTFSTGFST